MKKQLPVHSQSAYLESGTIPYRPLHSNLRTVAPGLERLQRSTWLPRHRHRDAYALIAVDGAFDQVNYAGRVNARPGDLILQPTLDCHANRTLSKQVTILRLPWPAVKDAGGVFQLYDLDAIVRAAQRDTDEAIALVARELNGRVPAAPRIDDWEDLLAQQIVEGRVGELRDWARAHAIAPETLSRGFRSRFGVSPSRFRLEWRTRTACLRIASGSVGLRDIAEETGFSDQAHMSRCVRKLTGARPVDWRPR